LPGVRTSLLRPRNRLLGPEDRCSGRDSVAPGSEIVALGLEIIAPAGASTARHWISLLRQKIRLVHRRSRFLQPESGCFTVGFVCSGRNSVRVPLDSLAPPIIQRCHRPHRSLTENPAPSPPAAFARRFLRRLCGWIRSLGKKSVAFAACIVAPREIRRSSRSSRPLGRRAGLAGISKAGGRIPPPGSVTATLRESQLECIGLAGRLGQERAVVGVVLETRAELELDPEPADALLGPDRWPGVG
jgi:hypothetical protein